VGEEVTFFLFGTAAPGGPGPPHDRGFMIILRPTTMGRTRLDGCSARRRDLYLTTHNTHIGQSFMPAGFEPTSQASEWPLTNPLSALYTVS